MPQFELLMDGETKKVSLRELKNDAAQGPPLPLGQRFLLPANGYTSACGKTADHIQKTRFSRAAGTSDQHRLSGCRLQLDAVEDRLDGRCRGVVELLEFKHDSQLDP